MTDSAAPRAERFVQDPATFAWTFGGYDPIRRVKPGEVLDLFVEDCFAGRIRSTADLPSTSIEFPFINPQTGPFYVEGAEPGDTIAVHLIDVRPARDWAVSAHVLFFGSLTGTRYTAGLQDALPEKVWLYRVDAAANELTFDARESDYEVRLPLEPFHGTIGVAPSAFEVRNVLVPEAYGGNMDSPDVKSGTTVYLGVNVPGALFSLGDGHYRMGEGEVCGAAVEGAMDTILTVELIKGVYCEWPRFEDDDSIMVAGSYRPLEDAFRIAHSQLVRWISGSSGLSISDTYQLVSQIATSRIANVVDPNYTIVARAPKRFLPRDIPWMDGAHERMRRIGRSVMADRPSR